MPEQLSEEQAQELQEKIKRMSPEELREFQKQQCIFCQIVGGKVPAKKAYEDEHSIAIMDINPAAPGHVLLLPKEHYAIMPQVPEKELGHLYLVAKYLSQVLLKVLKVGGTTVFVANGMVAGQRAQHFLLHLIPRKEGDGLLKAEEKYLEVSIQQKVQQVVEKRLNELLGVKKEVVRVEGKVGEKTGGEEKMVLPVLPSGSGKAGKKELGKGVASSKEVEAEFKDVEEEGEEESESKEEVEEKEEQQETEEKEEAEEKEETEEESEESEEDDEKNNDKEEKTSQSSTKKTKTPAKNKSEEGISLDDIAKLFA